MRNAFLLIGKWTSLEHSPAQIAVLGMILAAYASGSKLLAFIALALVAQQLITTQVANLIVLLEQRSPRKK